MLAVLLVLCESRELRAMDARRKYCMELLGRGLLGGRLQFVGDNYRDVVDVKSEDLQSLAPRYHIEAWTVQTR
jgi:hypothetical protein